VSDDLESRDAAPETRVGLVGKTLGRYRITAELGRGGMATVYRATDPQLGREVAIKVMHGAFAGRGDIERRFRREAQAVAAIRHQAIVSIYDFAPPAGGEPGYIVTEIVEGPTLRELMERHGGRLWPELAALLAARVAGALGAAHAHGIVHRDVKPDNVMIDVQPGAVRVLLTDFGVAHMADADTMTATGAILGSPTYMSPEQARGAEIGPPSDVFSLGVTLYHLVTGRPPFAGRDAMTAMAAILRGELLRPSQIDAHVGPALEGVILRCLKKLPAERYPDAGALAAALAEVSGRAGLGDSADELRRYFDDADGWMAALGPRVAAEAFEQARRCARRGELGRALGEINRVLAYQPAHAGAQSLLARITARRRLGKLAAAGLIVAVIAGVGYGAGQRLRAPRPTAARSAPIASVPAPAPAMTAPSPSPAPPPTAPPAPTIQPPARADAPPAMPRPSAKRARASSAAAAPPTGSPAPAASTAGATTTAALPSDDATRSTDEAAVKSEKLAATTTAAARAGAAVAPAGLILRASQGFCSPSMDDHPPSLHPSYDEVPPGSHRIYCTLPLPLPAGTKLLVASYDLRPGAHPNLVIVPGPDGRPTLARPQ
jgi:hypothetical protein